MYQVGNHPSDDKQFKEFIVLELKRISDEFNLQSDILRLSTTYVIPLKPRDGDIRLADGTAWNPGAGAGFYGYRGGLWRILG